MGPHQPTSPMSWYALIFVVAGGIVLAYFLSKALRSTSFEPGDPPSGWNDSDEAQEWDERAAQTRADYGLAAVRAGASKWSASIAALLGILSTVAFVAGPTDLVKDVGGWEAKLAGALILAAAGCALVGLFLAVMAEQGSPKWSDDLTGWKLKSLTRQHADDSAKKFLRSRRLVLVALLLVVLATAIAWAAALTGDKPSSQSAIVVMSGGAICGTLDTQDSRLTVKSGTTTSQIPENALVTLIASCP
jgi:hypothetical protein